MRHYQRLTIVTSSEPRPSQNVTKTNKLQNLYQTLCAKSEEKFSFMTKLRNLYQTDVNTYLSIISSNSHNLNKFLVVSIFKRRGLINLFAKKLVSEWVIRVKNDRTRVRCFSLDLLVVASILWLNLLITQH